MSFLDRYIRVFLMFVLLVFPVFSSAQYCFPSTRAIEPHFIINGGTVKDTRSGLIWMRCALGQQWQSETCVPLYDRLSWRESELMIDQLNHQGGAFGRQEWRLPTVAELLTIVDRFCEKPALDRRVFPRAPNTAYWASTPDPAYAAGAMLVHFINGHAYMGNRSLAWAVRLVHAP